MFTTSNTRSVCQHLEADAQAVLDKSPLILACDAIGRKPGLRWPVDEVPIELAILDASGGVVLKSRVRPDGINANAPRWMDIFTPVADAIRGRLVVSWDMEVDTLYHIMHETAVKHGLDMPAFEAWSAGEEYCRDNVDDVSDLPHWIDLENAIYQWGLQIERKKTDSRLVYECRLCLGMMDWMAGRYTGPRTGLMDPKLLWYVRMNR